MQLASYLSFDGHCEAAFTFYAKCLGGKIIGMHPYGSAPDAARIPPEFKNKIMHGRIQIGDSVLMGSDCTPEHPYKGMKGYSVSIGVDDPAEADRIFQALSEKGTIMMPIQATFWALRFGMLTDQFGVPWMINCERANPAT